MDKFSDGSASAYAELPVEAAYLSWVRGNAQLRQIAKEDPGAYFGGWRAFVTDRDGNPLPSLPIPVVDRMSEDGKHPYKVYASNVVNFLPLQHRTRFELRERYKDENGKDADRIINISKERRQGYAPYRQVFGLLFAKDKDEFFPAVLKVWKWSAFITFERAGQAWNKIKAPEGQVLVRRYGSIGVEENGVRVPNFEVYGQGRSTPIEAIGVSNPRFIRLFPELDDLWNNSLAWKNCERWNAEGKPQDTEAEVNPDLVALDARAKELGLSNLDIQDLIKEAGGDYKRALALIDATGVDKINQELEDGDLY